MKSPDIHDRPDALILAGGRGTRLKSVVSDRPKPMALVAGRPFAEWLILSLKRQGIRRIVFCTGYMGDMVRSFFREGEQWGVEIAYSHEPSPLGTGGAVRFALGHVCSNRLLVLNGDSYCRFDVERLLESHKTNRASVTMWLVRVADGSRYGSVALGPDGSVESFREKESSRNGGLINAGVYLMEREVVESIPSGKAVSLESETFPRWIGHGLYGVEGDGPFVDIGVPEEYAAADRIFAWSALRQ